MSNKKARTVLAVGADIKSKFLVARGDCLRFGPDTGDLSDLGNYEIFKRRILGALKRYEPEVIAHDLHPGYFSTRFAKDRSLRHAACRLKPVQHHHAHIASVMQEHGLEKPVIGISFDGTGFGTDGNIWGGEFLVTDIKGFERRAHLKYFRMPGGDRVIYEPWRMLIGILGKSAFPFIKKINISEKKLVLRMAERAVNSPLTSSAGRLFDAAAALLGICQYAAREAEGPVKLEALCSNGMEESYAFGVEKTPEGYVIDPRPIFKGMIADLDKKIKKNIIAVKFHNSIFDMIALTARLIARDTGIRDIVLSGGVFQNKFLKTKIMKEFSGSPFRVFSNVKFPVNDFNIAMGQYYVSCASGKS